MKTLIIYEVVPEEIQFYLMDFSEGALKKYGVVAGKYVNSTEMTEEELEVANELSELLEQSQQYRLTPAQLLSTQAEAVLSTGFVL